MIAMVEEYNREKWEGRKRNQVGGRGFHRGNDIYTK